MELKGGSGVSYRLATSEDFTKWYGGRQKYGAKAYIFIRDGEPIGIGGYKLHDKLFIIFSEIKENVILDKLTIYRAAKVIMELCSEVKTIKLAVSNNKRLCEMLGGKETNKGEFIWLN